jgi:H/ACA ribonucleoprotein complex subunit 2
MLIIHALSTCVCSLCVLAGDISPIDVISHIPVLCEDAAIPYVYITSKAELGAAAGTKRPTSVVLVASKRAKGGKVEFDAEDKLAEVVAEIKELSA